MNEHFRGQYTEDEVTRIIRRALKLRDLDTISHAELIETGRDIGLDSQDVETAIMQERQEYKREAILRSRLNRRKAGFYWHLWSYVAVNMTLVVINCLVPGPFWFQWSVLGWGIGLACHFKAIHFMRGKKYENRLDINHESAGCLMKC